MKIFLEKNTFQTTLEIDTNNMKQLLKTIPKIKKYIDEEWKITEVQGQGWAADLIREELQKSQSANEMNQTYKVGLNVVKSAYSHSPHKNKISFGRIRNVLKRKKKQ